MKKIKVNTENNLIINKYNFKDKDEYFETGRWISPVLEYETWINWSNTKEALEMNFNKDKLPVIFVDGHCFLPKDGLYFKLVKIIEQEFESKDLAFTSSILRLAESTSRQCLELAKSVKNRPSFDEFLLAFNTISRLRFPWMASFLIGDAAEKFINQYAIAEKIEVDKVREMVPNLNNSLTDDQKKLYYFRMKIKEKNLPFNIVKIEKGDPFLTQEIKNYQKETEFIGTHHFWGEERNLTRLLEAIENATQVNNDNQVYKNRDICFDIIAQATKWRLECAQHSAFLAYAYRPYLAEIARSRGLVYNDLIHLTTSEIKDLINFKTDYSSIIRDRKKAVGVFKFNNEMQVIVGKELQALKNHFSLLEKFKEVENFQGSIGNKGLVRGVVVVVLRPDDQVKVKPGMVLVSSETTPDFILAMGRAAAFVTDHGGITSHAAIVAREMGKPCVVGTKIATKALKDGDLVEVDADKGIVRILERRQNIKY